jgi:hypothetical protein
MNNILSDLWSTAKLNFLPLKTLLGLVAQHLIGLSTELVIWSANAPCTYIFNELRQARFGQHIR